MAANKLSMKLLIDKKGNRVLFAEAGKDVIDFLFSLLSLPLGSIIKLLNKANMVGCVANLYQSVEKFEDTYILQPNKHRELLLNPAIATSTPLNVPLLSPKETTPVNTSTASGGEKGYVKGVVTYMVMDDLSVKPMSTISSITLLNKFNVGNVGLLEERVVDLGVNEGLQVLKASLESKNVFSKVFLEQK